MDTNTPPVSNACSAGARLGGLGLLLVLLLLAPSVHAQISPDRPGMGEGTSVVAPKRLQLESGYGFVASDAATSHDFGQLLVRYGVSSWLEARAGVGSYVVHDAPVENGYSGTTLGGKVGLWQGERVNASALSTWGLPTGTGVYAESDAWQAVALAFDASVAGPVAVAASLGHTFAYGGESPAQTSFTATWGVEVNEAIGIGLGYAGFYEEGPNQNYLEGAATYLVNDDVQLDVNWAYRMGGDASEVHLGLGVARRF